MERCGRSGRMVQGVFALGVGVAGGMFASSLARRSSRSSRTYADTGDLDPVEHMGEWSMSLGDDRLATIDETGRSGAAGLRSAHAWLVPAILGALGLATLRHPTELVSSTVATASVAALMMGVIAARFGSESRRAYFWAFAAVGWVYLLLAFWPGPNSQVPRGDLVTTVLLNQFGEEIFPGPNGTTSLTIPEYRHFQIIGHALFAILAGHLGGLLAERLARRPSAAVHGGEASPTTT